MAKRSVEAVFTAIVLAVMITGWISPELLSAGLPQATSKTVWDGVYSEEQAKRGGDAYRAVCSSCHRSDLSGYNGALRGTTFMNRWREDNLESLFNNIKTTMPRNNPGILKPEMYLDIVTYILQQNSFPSGQNDLGPDTLKNIQVVGKDGSEALPAGALAQVYGCITAGPDNTWILTSATAPARTRNPDKSSDEDLKAAADRPAGMQTYRLMDAAFYHPERHKDEKVEVKGFLMKEPADGLTLTSLTTISPQCQNR